MAAVNEVRGTMHFLKEENSRLAEENSHLQDEIVRLRLVLRNLGSLQQHALHIDAYTDAMQLLDRILRLALDTVGAEDGSLLLTDPDSRELVFVAVQGAVKEQLTGYRIPIGEGIAGYVAQTAQPVIIANAQLDQRFSVRVDVAFNFRTRSVLASPIVHDNEVKGVIQLLNKQNRQEFNQSDLMLLNLVAQLAADAIARAERFAEEGA